MENDNDLHRAHALAVLAILQANESAERRMTPEQRAERDRRLADGSGRLVLVVTNDGRAVHVELALADPKSLGGRIFDSALLIADGPVESPAAPPGTVTLTNRAAMN